MSLAQGNHSSYLFMYLLESITAVTVHGVVRQFLTSVHSAKKAATIGALITGSPRGKLAGVDAINCGNTSTYASSSTYTLPWLFA